MHHLLSSDHIQVFVFSPRVRFWFLVILKCKAFFLYDFGLFIRTFHPGFGIRISLIATALFKQASIWAKQGMYQRFNLSQFQNIIKQPFKLDKMNTLCFVILGKKRICSMYLQYVCIYVCIVCIYIYYHVCIYSMYVVALQQVQCLSKKNKLVNFLGDILDRKVVGK